MDWPVVLELFHVVALTIDHIVKFIQAQALMVFIPIECLVNMQ